MTWSVFVFLFVYFLGGGSAALHIIPENQSHLVAPLRVLVVKHPSLLVLCNRTDLVPFLVESKPAG